MTGEPRNSVLKIKAGDISIFFEGSEDFISSKLALIVQEIAKYAKDLPSKQSDVLPEMISLPEFWKKQKQRTQVRRFLVVAAWLQKNGRDDVKVKEVDQAIEDHHLEPIKNSSHNLSSNKKKGFCAVSGHGTFYVTQKGLEEVGLA